MSMCPRCGSLGPKYKGYALCKECRKRYQKKYRKIHIEEALTTVRRCSDAKRFGVERSVVIQSFCENCGGNGALSIHHRDGNGRNSLKPNNRSENLMTLCNVCHGSVSAIKRPDITSSIISSLCKQGCSYREIGRRFNVCKDTVRYIAHGKRLYDRMEK